MLGRDMSESVKGRAAAPRAFDGIICIGGSDWWYHNRGHFDFQIMRRLARQMPVLYVNSLGVRMPSLKHNGQFGSRMSRKLKSLGRGLVTVENKFSVFSPAMVPGELGMKLSSWALAPQIRGAARRAGIRKPLLWVHCPAGAPLIGDLGAVALVLQRTDRFEAFPEGDRQLIGGQIAKLKAAADLVIYAAEHLQQDEVHEVERSLLVTHGVDFDAFVAAGDAKPRDPIDMVTIPRPRVGFIGGIDAHTFDPALFLATAGEVKEANFVMCGGCSLPEGWCTLPNVKFIGRKPYEEVARIMAACDVLIMPWNDSAWIKACNPIKLKEYLAVGRPIVSRDFPALDSVRDVVRVADNPAAFAAAIRASLEEPYDPAPGRLLIQSESWDGKAEAVRAALEALEFAPPRRKPAAQTPLELPAAVSQTVRAARRSATVTPAPEKSVEPMPQVLPSQAVQPPPPLRLKVRAKPKRSRVRSQAPLSPALQTAIAPDDMDQGRPVDAFATPDQAADEVRIEPPASSSTKRPETVIGLQQQVAAFERELQNVECEGEKAANVAPIAKSATQPGRRVALTPREIKRQQLNAVVASVRENVTKKRRWYQIGGGPAKATSRSGKRGGG